MFPDHVRRPARVNVSLRITTALRALTAVTCAVPIAAEDPPSPVVAAR